METSLFQARELIKAGKSRFPKTADRENNYWNPRSQTWEEIKPQVTSGVPPDRDSSRVDSVTGNELRTPADLRFRFHEGFHINQNASYVVEDIMMAQRTRREVCYELPDENVPLGSGETEQDRLATLFNQSKLQLERAMEANALQRKRNILFEVQVAGILEMPGITKEAPAEWMLEFKRVQIRSKTIKTVDPNKADMALKQLRKLVLKVMTDTYELKEKLWAREYELEELRFVTKSPYGSIRS
jgi:hypothetical protein